jgi:murein DD-endopeptidase MepM/ murein hydrolase activator NlpD
MKILIGFVLGVLCGVAAMFYLPDWLQMPRDAQPVGADALQGTAPEAPARTASMPAASPASAPAQAAPVEAATVPVATVALDSSVSAVVVPAPADMADLPRSAVSGLLIPVVGVKPRDLTDTFTQARGSGRVHDAIDIMAARGTPVVAANDGHVVKLFTSEPGGLTVYEFDPDNRVIYYYAHLDGYASGLAEGQVLHRGDPVGFVGSTGNASADAPHLHFEVEILGPEKQWWHATSINPYGRFEGQQPAHGASAAVP